VTRPSPPAPSSDERELLLGFIRWKRDLVLATTDGLTDDQLRWSPPGGTPSLLGIVNHLTHMEWRWVEGRYLGRPFPKRTDEFAPTPSLTGEAAIAAYRRRGDETDAVVRSAPGLGVPCVGDEGGRGAVHELMGYTTPIDLRWVLLHVLEETSHHAGHADATRQLLDGTTQT
jgi:hypothetical protein